MKTLQSLIEEMIEYDNQYSNRTREVWIREICKAMATEIMKIDECDCVGSCVGGCDSKAIQRNIDNFLGDGN